MLAYLTRIHVIVLIAAACLAMLWSIDTRPVISAAPIDGPRYTDLRLYDDIAGAVRGGEGYYSAATRLQRLHGYPNRPFVAVRLPTLGMLTAWLGPGMLHGLLLALVMASALFSLRAFEGIAGLPERAGVALAILAGSASLIRSDFALQHEIWAGTLLGIALFNADGARWKIGLAAAGLALFIRELALPFVLLMGSLAAFERNWRQLAAWAGLLAIFVLVMFEHSRLVAPWVQPQDIASSGWSAMRGPGAALRDLVKVSLLSALPAWLSGILALLPLIGWLAAPPRLGGLAMVLAGGFLAMSALFARDQNYYWAMLLLPWWFAGFALVPRGIRQLHLILRDGSLPQSG